VKRIRVSQGVTRGMVIRKVEPAYPKIALGARITGVVLLKAIIGKDGDIKELQVISGLPMLIPAALDAVKQWRYAALPAEQRTGRGGNEHHSDFSDR
jgi:TonB family protein